MSAPRKVLVVDYEPDHIRSVTEMLESAGYEVEVANDGVAAMEAYRARHHEGVVLEAMLPKKHGFEVCKEIKNEPSGDGTAVIITDNCPTVTIPFTAPVGCTYIAGLSASIVSPGIPLGGTNFQLDLLDALFNLTFPVNTLAPLVQGLQGPTPGLITLDLSLLPVGLTLDLDLWLQGVKIGGGVVQATNLVPIKVRI